MTKGWPDSPPQVQGSLGSRGSLQSSSQTSFTGGSPSSLTLPFSRRPAASARRMAHVFSAPFIEIHNCLDAPVTLSVATHTNSGKAAVSAGGGSSQKPVPQTRTMGPGTSTSFTLARGTISAYVTVLTRHPGDKHRMVVLKQDQLVNNLDLVTLG